MADIGPGSVVEDRYRIDQVVASGSEEAYRGVVLRSGRPVQLVVVPPPVAQTLRRVTLLSHPNLATLLEVVPRPAGYALAVFEATDGPSLADVLAVEPALDPRRAAVIAAAIGDALTALHHRGGAHGLVRPASVVVEPDETRAAVLAYAPLPPSPSPFQSPERGVGAPSPADDVWALAATLHTMILGTPPPTAGYSSRSGVVRAGITDLELATLLANCLARRPEQRVTLVAPVRDALLGYRPSTTVALPSRPPSAWPAGEGFADARAPSLAPAPATPRARDASMPAAPASEPAEPEPALATTAASEAPPASVAAGARNPALLWGLAALVLLTGAAVAAVARWRSAPRAPESDVANGEPVPTATRSAAAQDEPTDPRVTAGTSPAGRGAAPSEVASAEGPDRVEGVDAGRAVTATSLPSEEEIAACVARVSPPESFRAPPRVAWLCEDADPRAGYRHMKVAVVLGSTGRVTPAMSLWSRLNWYGMAGVAILRGACCGEPRPFELPPTTGCDDTADALNELARTVATRGDVAPAVERYGKSVRCQSSSGRSAYFELKASLGGGEATTFQEVLDFLLKQR